MRRIEWIEQRRAENVRVIADETPGGWEFFERPAWEEPWYKIDSTPELRAKALLLVNADEHSVHDGHRQSSRKRGEDKLIRVLRITELDTQPMPPNILPRVKQDTRLQKTDANPWVFSSFYLFAVVVLAAVGMLVARTVHYAAPIILLFVALSIVILGSLQLGREGRLTQGNFLHIMLECVKSLGLFGIGSRAARKQEPTFGKRSRRGTQCLGPRGKPD
jgi:hypothetical protein